MNGLRGENAAGLKDSKWLLPLVSCQTSVKVTEYGEIGSGHGGTCLTLLSLMLPLLLALDAWWRWGARGSLVAC